MGRGIFLHEETNHEEKKKIIWFSLTIFIWGNHISDYEKSSVCNHPEFCVDRHIHRKRKRETKSRKEEARTCQGMEENAIVGHKEYDEAQRRGRREKTSGAPTPKKTTTPSILDFRTTTFSISSCTTSCHPSLYHFSLCIRVPDADVAYKWLELHPRIFPSYKRRKYLRSTDQEGVWSESSYRYLFILPIFLHWKQDSVAKSLCRCADAGGNLMCVKNVALCFCPTRHAYVMREYTFTKHNKPVIILRKSITYQWRCTKALLYFHVFLLFAYYETPYNSGSQLLLVNNFKKPSLSSRLKFLKWLKTINLSLSKRLISPF